MTKTINKVYYVKKYIIIRFGIDFQYIQEDYFLNISFTTKNETNKATHSNNCSKEVRVEVQDT